MMKLRYDKAEGVVRSVGDPPHGILVIGQNEEGLPAFMVSPSWEPTMPDLGMNSVEIGEDVPDGAVAIPLPEIVAAAGEPMVPVLWKAAVMSYEAAHSLGLHVKGTLDPIALGVVLLNDLKAEIMAQYGGMG